MMEATACLEKYDMVTLRVNVNQGNVIICTLVLLGLYTFPYNVHSRFQASLIPNKV